MAPATEISNFLANWAQTPFAHHHDRAWLLPQELTPTLLALLPSLDETFAVAEGVAVHESATVELGATIKGPAIIGPDCFIASSSYLRGGVWLEKNVIVGPAAELKTSVILAGSKLAHLNFVGDSIVGNNVNIEAGAMIANYRNELDDKTIRIDFDSAEIDTGVQKFGSLIGDGVRIGANAVIAPGALLRPGSIIPRLGLVDQRWVPRPPL